MMEKFDQITRQMRSSKLIEAATAYAEAGIPVLPLWGVRNGRCLCGKPNCDRAGKHPMEAICPHGFKNARSDAGWVRRIWTKHPNANIGLVASDGLLVIDIDGEAGEAGVAELNLPPTAAVRTGRGRHLYFRTSSIAKPRKLPEVDFRHRGNGYVVAPPSIHAKGDIYQWQSHSSVASWAPRGSVRGSSVVSIDFTGTGGSIQQGGRNNRLASIAGMLRSAGLSKTVVEETLQVINRENCSPPLDRAEVRAIARSVSRYASRSEEYFGDMASVKAEEVKFLYGPYIPRGCVTLIDGDPGLGKSNFVIALAAHLSSNRRLPWSEDRQHGRVLLLSAEDDPARVLKPRLVANEADCERIRFMSHPLSFDEKGLSLLRQELDQNRADLVIVDPIVNFLSSDDDLHRADDMMRLLGRLDEIARDYDAALVLVRHLRKSGEGAAIYRGMGSIAVLGRARSALVIGRDPDDPAQRAIAHVKSNYAQEGPTVLFMLVNKNEVPVVRWCGINEELTAEQLLAAPARKQGRPPDEIDAATNFLIEILTNGEVEKGEIIAAAKGHHSDATIRRARESLRLVINNRGRKSYWSLPREMTNSR